MTCRCNDEDVDDDEDVDNVDDVMDRQAELAKRIP